MTIGKRIRVLRDGLGLTQDELGTRLGITGSAVAMWETDACKPSISRLVAIAKELEVSVDALLGEKAA